MSYQTWTGSTMNWVKFVNFLTRRVGQQGLDSSTIPYTVPATLLRLYSGKSWNRTFTKAFKAPELYFEGLRSLCYLTMNPTSQFLLGVKAYLNNCTWKSTCDDIFRGRSQECQYGHIDFEREVGLYQSGGSREYCEPQNLSSLLSTRVVFITLLRSSYSIISPSCFSPEFSNDEYFTKCSEHCWFSIPDSQRDWLMGWNHERLYCYHPWFMPIQPKLDRYYAYGRDRWDMLRHDFKQCLVCAMANKRAVTEILYWLAI